MSTSLTPLSCLGLTLLPPWEWLNLRRRREACLSSPPHLDRLGSCQTLLKPVKVVTLSIFDSLPFINSHSSAILTLSEMELNRRVAGPIRTDTPRSLQPPCLHTLQYFPVAPLHPPYPLTAAPPDLHAIVFHSAVLPVLRRCSAA